MDLSDAEDAAFHADLTRQMLMLIMDDEEETHARRDIKGGSEFRRRSVVSYGSCGGGYFSWSESGRSVEVPSWMERLWAGNGAGGGAGTGVFIPQVVAAAGKSRRRRRNKPRKNNVNYGGIRIHG
ncbi:hypothetical protein L1987_12119 [Smallanthus sonchifolius]|uniref:Uncharacterized protein n=1 Tax=Smallanthus sonchifolius TaxID=185202 RepID=A0ACB9JFI0_9ASTR|nr:hypothetical protein L1987_12119 [Smallanthus sonchifolius]